MHLAPVVEGVEDAEQLSIVSDLGASLIQGFYFAKPMQADEVEKIPIDNLFEDDFKKIHVEKVKSKAEALIDSEDQKYDLIIIRLYIPDDKNSSCKCEEPLSLILLQSLKKRNKKIPAIIISKPNELIEFEKLGEIDSFFLSLKSQIGGIR